MDPGSGVVENLELCECSELRSPLPLLSPSFLSPSLPYLVAIISMIFLRINFTYHRLCISLQAGLSSPLS